MSAFQFKGRSEDARQIGHALNVTMLLEGSVRTAGKRLRITAQLINVEDGYHLWSDRYDRQKQDVFDIQDEITSEIIYALKGRIGGHDVLRPRRFTENVEAYHLYLKGRYFWLSRQKGSMQKTLETYRQAAEMDPSYALPLAGLCWTYCVYGLHGVFPPDRAYAMAKPAGERALELDRDASIADVQICAWNLAYVYEWDYQKAERVIRHAINIEPGNVVAHIFYGSLLSTLGRADEASAEFGQAQELDPLSPYARAIAAWAYSMAGKTERAITECRKALDIEPDMVQAMHPLGGELIRASKHAEALSVLERLVEVAGRMPIWVAMLGWGYGAAGKRDQALGILRELITRSETEYVSPLFISWVLSRLEGEGDPFEWLERAFEEKSPFLVYWRFPVFDALSADQRFDELLPRLNLTR